LIDGGLLNGAPNALDAGQAASGENERAKESSSARLLLRQKEVIVRPHICQR